MLNFRNISGCAALIAAVVIAAGSSALAAPTPILFSQQGTVTCAQLNGLANTAHGGAFAHMTTNWELKDDSPTGATLQPLNSSNGFVIEGGMPANNNLFLTYSLSGGGTQMSAWSLAWNAPQHLDRLVSAIIVKGGPNGTNVYPYNPLDNGDNGPFIVPGGVNAISHISFCFEPFTAPSAADAEISGRVVDRYGRGISLALITVTNLSTGEVSSTRTNNFGYYKVEGLPVANFYSLAVSHSRFKFFEPVRTFSLDDSLTDVDFAAIR